MKTNKKLLAAIGDIHGRSEWKPIVAKGYDHVIFIGDYFDTHENIKAKEQIENFKEIIAFKKANSNVALLIGNHDFHYMRGIDEKYSGFQPDYYLEIQEVLHTALDMKYLKASHQEGDILFTHAGVTNTWAQIFHHSENISESINELFEANPKSLGFTPCPREKFSGIVDYIGDEICQSPLWVRPNSLLKDKLTGYRQVVGHTPQPEMRIESGVAFIDCLMTSGEYLVIEDGKFLAERL